MADGFAPYILRSLKTLAGINYPGTKIRTAGFLQLLLENTNIAGVQLVEENGHQKVAKIKYMQRVSPSLVADNDTCDVDFVPAYKEADLNATRFSKIAFYMSRETVSKYLEDASRMTSIGSPPTRVMQEIVDTISHMANSLIGKIDQVMLNDVDWGVNVVYGNDAVQDLNINKDATVFDLDSGYAKLLNDAFENEFFGQLLIAGQGKFNMLELTRMAGALSTNQSGLDISRFTGYKFYPDAYSKNSVKWGGDNIGVFAPGSIHFVDFTKYVGFRTGKLGTSTFFQLTLDVNGTPMKFDAQLRELDCPTEIPNVYGTPTLYGEGYVLYLKKAYGLFQLPVDSYGASDELVGNNGSIHYKITNICEDCEA